MQKKYKVGMYGGKFMPFHKGHMHCIEVASSQCELLYVILFHGGDQEIEILKTKHEEWLQPENRLKRVQEACKKFKNVKVIPIDVTECKFEDGTEDWDKETQLVLDACGPLNAVYGSEPEYTEYYKRAFPEATYELIDVERKDVPISGTMIREMNEEERKIWII